MRAFLMVYVSDFDGDDDCVPYKLGKSTSSERRAFTLLSSVCSSWRETLTGWSVSSTGQSVKQQLKKTIEREFDLLFWHIVRSSQCHELKMSRPHYEYSVFVPGSVMSGGPHRHTLGFNMLFNISLPGFNRYDYL